uniref:Alpha-farnesene synthase n=1 Tax=Pinus taeda TaxID=3352 RepID=PT5_PINTA|nr:RecName: Full=Alpha-farnesene synthase [Pinus taeda]AAO61226.1 alpha-farnesene synthase [Pinus taeda]
MSSLAVDDAERRVGDYHPNLWDDALIQSLSTPYGASPYRDVAEKLIGEIKEMFASISIEDGDDEICYFLQRLWMIDNVERLGISRHFENEIKAAMEDVYSRHWSDKGIACGRHSVVADLNSTALAFRTLRLHGYSVCSDVFKIFQDQKGEFACSADQTEGEIKGILNLLRASLIAFPGERILQEAEIFATTYLKEALPKIQGSRLSQEIEYVLEYGWLTDLPRLETRNYIEVLAEEITPYFKKPCMAVEKLLKLAKIEFNLFHSLQQTELKHLSRWWKDSGFAQLTFTRHRHVEFYTLASCIAMEPKHSAFRLGFAKLCYLGIVLDDIYDTYGKMEELELFTAAIKRWDTSTTECLPEYMKGVYMAFYDCVNEMARQAEKTQGWDTLDYARKTWEALIDAFMEEAKWISSGYVPTFQKYLDNGKVSFGYRAATLQPILTLDIPLPLHILQEIDFPSSFNDLASSILRLRGDICGYQAERSRGEQASSISCYMKDNPGSTEEDALSHVNAMIGDKIPEFNWEFMKPSKAPISSKKYAFDILRAFYHLYKYRDGFSIAKIETKKLVMRTVLDPVPM